MWHNLKLLGILALMLNYRLQVFRKVAELQNMTRAARALHLSQPAVTKHVQLLERELRIPLFTRTANGMLLTEAGVVYLRHVQQLAQAHEDMARQLHASSGVVTGRLRLGSNKTVLSYVLPDILAQFKRRYPSVTCDIMDGNTDTIVGALLDQHIDLAIVEGPCQRPEIQQQTILEDDIIWIACPSDPIAKLERPTVKAVLQRPLIVREIGAGGRQFMEQALRKMQLRMEQLNIIQEVPSPEAIKRLVAAGLGISYVFRVGVERELAAGKLVEINCPKLNIRRFFSLLHPRGPIPSGLGQTFVQLLIERRGQKSDSNHR
jgi:DNA-binding transcriptional LysR family regulator